MVNKQIGVGKKSIDNYYMSIYLEQLIPYKTANLSPILDVVICCC